MTARRRAMLSADAGTRAAHARAFLAAADLVEEFGADAGIDDSANLIGSLAVLAGIAASDAICGYSLGECAGEHHGEAITLLKRATPPGDASSARLKRLLDAKSTTQYSANLISATRAGELLTAARRLVERANALAR